MPLTSIDKNTIFTILSRALKVNTQHVKRKQISQHLSSLHCGKNAGTVLVNRTTDDYLRRWNVINSHEPFTAFKIRTGYDMTFQQDYLLRQHFACSMFCSSGFMQHTNTPVFLITALDEYSEHLPLRPSHFHTPRCRKLKFWFHVQFFILYKTR